MSNDVISIHEESSCNCKHDCDCPAYDSLVFRVNGIGGYGSGEWVESMDTPSRRFFACKFMGLEFEARNKADAQRQLAERFSGFNHVKVKD